MVSAESYCAAAIGATLFEKTPRPHDDLGRRMRTERLIRRRQQAKRSAPLRIWGRTRAEVEPFGGLQGSYRGLGAREPSLQTNRS